MKDRLSKFSDEKKGWWGDPFHMKFWTKLTQFEQKKPIFNQYSLVAR